MNFFKKFNKLDFSEKNNKKKIISIAITIFAVALIATGTSMAYLINQGIGDTNTITAGTLVLELDNETNGISLNSAVPMTDELGIAQENSYNLTLRNNGTLGMKYTIRLTNNCSTTNSVTINGTNVTPDICIPSNYIKVATKEANGEYNIVNLQTSEGVLLQGTLSSNKTTTIELKLWLDEETPNTYQAYQNGVTRNVVFYGKLNLQAEQYIEPPKPTILSMYQSGDLEIGDFVTYDAGTWTASEIASIQVGPNSSLVSANNSTAAPSTDYQFGGFVAGQSRNIGAIEYINGTYMYAKMYDGNDSSNLQPLSGWRVFDIDNNYVTLISAANPEDYFHPGGTNFGYISQYILTGTKHSSWTDNETNYTKRDWSMYENSAYGASNARVLTKTDLDNWYNKYMGVTNANTYTQSTFQRIYSSPYLAYQNLIDNHTYCWLGSAYGATGLYLVYPISRVVLGTTDGGYGVRLLVSIPLTSTIQDTIVTTRTITLDGMKYYNSSTAYGPETTQEYNVWRLM